MTERELEAYLKRLDAKLRLNSKRRTDISHELRDHVQTRLEDLVADGHSLAEAIRVAIEECGEPDLLADEFISIQLRNRRRWTMRFATFSIVGCFLGFLLIFSLWPEQNRLPLAPISNAQEAAVALPVTRDQSVEARNAKTRARLDESIAAFVYEDVPFGDILADLCEQHELDVFLDESSDLKAETMIKTHFKNIRLSMALDLLVRQHNSQYIVRDGILLIASIDTMSELGAEVRVYNCRDLIGGPALMPTAVRGVPFDTENKLFKAVPVEADPNSANHSPQPADMDREAALMTLVKTVVSPVSWLESGNAVAIYDGLLIVNNTAIVHLQIEELLMRLRQATAEVPSAARTNPE